MAPKKKKKPAANPARAVATTSIASKPKVDKKLDSADASETGSAATPATPATPGDAAPSPAGAAPAPRELHQLSPEELEQQLERNELQLLVEKHAQKVRKESSRHITRVQTDRRVLRTQAQYLPTREWLPGDLTTQILDLIKDEINEDFSSPEHKYSIRSLSEEDVILRLWTLSQTLADMGFSKDRVRQMLVLICRNPPPLDANTPIWGLQESLEWFAVNCPPDELPPYESQALPPAIDTSSSSRSSKSYHLCFRPLCVKPFCTLLETARILELDITMPVIDRRPCRVNVIPAVAFSLGSIPGSVETGNPR